MHRFNHKGEKIIIATGFPDELFVIDAEKMTLIKRIIIKEPYSVKNIFSGKRSTIGTISPSLDGEKLFVQTTSSFQVIDLATGDCEYSRTYFFNHSCSNHMLTSRDIEW